MQIKFDSFEIVNQRKKTNFPTKNGKLFAIFYISHDKLLLMFFKINRCKIEGKDMEDMG